MSSVVGSNLVYDNAGENVRPAQYDLMLTISRLIGIKEDQCPNIGIGHISLRLTVSLNLTVIFI